MTASSSSFSATNQAAPEAPEPLKDAVLTTTLDGVITHCNLGLSRYGFGPEDLVGTNLHDLFSSESQSVLAKLVIPTVREKGRCEATLHGQTRRSEEYALHARLSLLRDASSTPTGMVAVVSEITESKRPAGRDGTRSSASQGIARRVIDGTEFLIASPVMHKFMGMVDRVAGHTETVLVIGETGTGKELVARTIHESSYRYGKALVDINCAALPEHLVESELFGYEKGAFSGADSSKPGLFELADHSTIFLDEIGELQPQIQVKLLRVLDGAPYYRLGGHRKISVDVRVVAATNQDLEAAVKEGRFRKDLFHRLSQFQLRVPPLRERPEDIAALAQHFLMLKAPDKAFSSDAISAMQAYSWPGNIRELRNSIAKLAMSGNGAEITASEVTSELRQDGTPSVPARRTLPQGNLENMEEQMIIQALEQTGGHKTQAAEQLGISRRTLTRKLREYGIEAGVGEGSTPLGIISQEQQKFFRAKVNIPVTLRNAAGKETQAQAINLSTGGMGLDSVNDPAGFAGVLDVSFLLPDSETVMHAKGRLVWADVGGRAGLRFVVIEPELFQHLQRWTNEKMKNEGWELPS
ncbi:MAG TPA: sigma 54-interacting transcriptional regulator [Terriglobales bacterium]|nr:sigma 54-interacting transcriptional regulator [Terriglobales bacterium]